MKLFKKVIQPTAGTGRSLLKVRRPWPFYATAVLEQASAASGPRCQKTLICDSAPLTPRFEKQ